MLRALRLAVRFALVFWGFTVITVGAASLLFPGIMRSEDPRPSTPTEVALEIALVGHGLFLALPPRWLLNRLLCWPLVVATLLLFACGVSTSIERGGEPDFLVIFLPALAVGILVRAEARRRDAVHCSGEPAHLAERATRSGS